MGLRSGIIIHSPWRFSDKIAYTLYPFILILPWRDQWHSSHPECLRYRARTINHERIHIRQSIELLIIPFYFLYTGDKIRLKIMKRLGKADICCAYHNIAFEAEAFAHQLDTDYLKTRKLWAWRKFIY